MTDKTREAFEAWIEAPDRGYKDQASIYWSAFASGAKHARATSAADAKYLPVIEKLVEALIMSEAIEVVYLGVDGEKNKQAQIRGFKRKRKKALALAKPLLGKREEV